MSVDIKLGEVVDRNNATKTDILIATVNVLLVYSDKKSAMIVVRVFGLYLQSDLACLSPQGP